MVTFKPETFFNQVGNGNPTLVPVQ